MIINNDDDEERKHKQVNPHATLDWGIQVRDGLKFYTAED